MRWRVYLLIVFVGLFAVPTSVVGAEVPLQEQYLRIYLEINDAENLEKNGDFRGALDKFRDCYTKLAKIHHDNPDWEKALVLHRMEDCKAKIDELTIKVNAMGPAPTPTPVVPPPVPHVPEAVPTGTNVMVTPAVPPAPPLPPVSELPDDVPTLKKKLTEMEQQLRATQDNLRDSQTQLATYQARVETLNSQLQALASKSGDDKASRLLADNKELLDKLTAAQKQLDDFKKNPKSRLAQVEAQLKSVQEQLEASQSANTTLQTSLTTLQQRFDESQAALVVANQKLGSVDPSSPQYATIKHENELMRAMMQRELQEQARRDQARRLYQEEFDALKIKSSTLQEQFDNMTTPPFPPTTDEERNLLNSLKVTSSEINPPPVGNGFAAPAAGSGDGTNAASGTPPDVANPALTGETGAMADASLNPTYAPTIKTDTAPPPPPAVPSTPSAPPSAPDVTPAPPATNAPDVNATSPVPPDGVTNPAPPTPPSPPAVTVAENNTKPTPPADTQPANEPATVTHVPPPTETVTTTTVAPGGDSAGGKQPDPTEWSNKARLPEDMRDTAQMAADFFSSKKYDEAAAKYQVIIDKYPESLYAWSNLGVVRFQQGDLTDALKALQQAVKISPTDAFSYSNLGIVYYNLNQYENAIDALQAAKALDPKDAKIRNYLGCACSQKGWQEVAEKEFRAAIDIDPNFADAHFNLALLYATQKPPALELARKEYDKARELGVDKDDRLEKLLQPK